MKKLIRFALIVALAFGGTSAFADGLSSPPWFPLGLSIVAPPVQLPSPSHAVFGAMINLGYGQVDGLAILDVGLVNNVTDEMVGLELGPVNLAGSCVGAQVGALNIADDLCGLQLGVVNFTGDLHGVQLGLINMSSEGGALVFPILNFGF